LFLELEAFFKWICLKAHHAKTFAGDHGTRTSSALLTRQDGGLFVQYNNHENIKPKNDALCQTLFWKII